MEVNEQDKNEKVAMFTGQEALEVLPSSRAQMSRTVVSLQSGRAQPKRYRYN